MISYSTSQQTVQIKFSDKNAEHEMRQLCDEHDISFQYIEERLNEDYLIVETGETRFHDGQKAVLESPSRRLDALFHSYISGTSYARGKPIRHESAPILAGVDLFGAGR